MCIFFQETETPDGSDRGRSRECVEERGSRLVNVIPLLTYFHQFLQEGDYLVVEDCNPNTQAVTGAGSVYQDEEYVPWASHKL